MLSAELRSELSGQHSRKAGQLEDLRKRISYFMLFRLGLLAVFTLLAAFTTWLVEDHVVGMRDWIAWSTVAAGYLVTLVFAWQLRPNRESPRNRAGLHRIAWLQTGFDVAFAVVGVALTGGVDSGFVFLFLIAVLGAATMGTRPQIWATAGASGLLYVGLSVLQLLGMLVWLRGPDQGALESAAVGIALLRTTGAIGLVAILSAYLNSQLLSSVSQIGSLRALNENIVRSLSSGLVTVDQDGYVLFVNPTALELLGRTDELAGRSCDELIPTLRAHLDDSGGFRNRFEIDVERRSDNRVISLGVTCSPLLDEDGSFLGHIVNFQDVTELREMERVLRRSERLAALGTLAASVAHEVRNPLAAISGCAELLDTATLGDEDQRLIRVIRRESTRLADIVAELLDYTRPRKPQRTNVDLRRMLTELADSFRADPGFEEVELVSSLPSGPAWAELDPNQLIQVLWNLVRNGAEAMDGRGRLELGLQAEPTLVRISVRDFGRGIPAEDIDHIFEPFYSTKAGGTGIGLALVHRIIEEHGGEIQVFTSVGEGTRFVLELPRQSSSSATV